MTNERLCQKYKPIVWSEVGKLCRRFQRLDRQDMIQEGYLALIRAYERYRENRYTGKLTSFSSYAKSRVSSHLRDVALQESVVVSIPRSSLWEMWKAGQIHQFFRAKGPLTKLPDNPDGDMIKTILEVVVKDPEKVRAMFMAYLKDREGRVPVLISAIGRAVEIEQKFGSTIGTILRSAYEVFHSTEVVSQLLGVPPRLLSSWAHRYCGLSVRDLRRGHDSASVRRVRRTVRETHGGLPLHRNGRNGQRDSHAT